MGLDVFGCALVCSYSFFIGLNSFICSTWAHMGPWASAHEWSVDQAGRVGGQIRRAGGPDGWTGRIKWTERVNSSRKNKAVK
jgi:hypothetical protein